MKTSISITLILVGAALILAPMIMNYMDSQQPDGENVTIAIKGKNHWGSTASMTIGAIAIGMVGLFSLRREHSHQTVFISKTHELGEPSSSIRGDLQFTSKAPTIPIQSQQEEKPSTSSPVEALETVS